ncbi:MAG: AmmeMemoRadiSam system protein B [Phaeodactylibacter sp.]|nr:AmmeMemoRadiSam system protein B [Phaeodactylibacter sp.]MCB9290347.1 AmmeMemoRadiSam system protein B [Lewinellaceae bacterium]
MAVKTRKSAVSGQFYPADGGKLLSTIAGLLEQASVQPAPEGPLKALIVPHAGYVYSGQVAAYAYALLKNESERWKRVVAIGPAHTVLMHHLATDPNDYWETPVGKVSILHDGFIAQESAHINEHSLEVQLPFLQYVLADFRFLPLIAGKITPKDYCRAVEDALGEDGLLLISSDLSHFYDYDTACELDQATNRAIESLDYQAMEQKGIACGKIPILIALDIARRKGWKCRLLNYCNSGDVSHRYDSVVGYASFGFFGS